MLLAILGLAASAGMIAPERGLGMAVLALGFTTIAAGLISSTFHLGHPERAWRAFSQWRSSWLSREGILSLATFVPALVFAWGWVIEGNIWKSAGISTAILAVASVSATAMIYASLKPIKAWRNGWTLPLYLTTGLLSGSIWAALLAAMLGNNTTLMFAVIAVMGAIVSSLVALFYWRYIDRERIAPSTESATGLGRFGKVSPFLAPHTEENYVQKEMGFRIARKHAGRLRSVALWIGLIGPGLLALSAGQAGYFSQFPLATGFLSAAALLNAIGTLAQRWLFFAEAKHTITLFYPARSDAS